MNPLGEALGLSFRRDFETNAKACAARRALQCTVLSIEAGPGLGVWKPFGFFDAEGKCVATLDAALLPMVIDEKTQVIGAIRSVATHPAWRARGLFRMLLNEALAWLDVTGAGFVLLYSAEPAIYARFGFHEVPQHAFVGQAPSPGSVETVHALPATDVACRRLVNELLADRAQVSRCALQIDPDQYLYNVDSDPDLRIAYLVDADALLVYEESGRTLVIVDVIARVLPSIARLASALNFGSRPIKTLFEPSLLGWHGNPVPEDTGLMARGRLPDAMSRPFMLPPTVEF